MPFWVIALTTFLFSCNDKCETTYTYLSYEPVYMTLSDVRNGVTLGEPVELNYPGKIYLYDHYLLVNEAGKGIHIIDDADPSSPVNLAFLNIPGNFDMAVKDNTLYADSYIDLLVFDINDVKNIKELKRLNDVFRDNYSQIADQNGVASIVAEWKEKEVQTVYDECEGIVPVFLRGGVQVDFAAKSAMSSTYPAYFSGTTQNSVPSGANVGIGGSMARFAVMNDVLYTVGSYSLSVFDIFNVQNPVSKGKVEIGWGIETIFPYKNNLFIGAQNGMHIFNVSEPTSPEYVSTFAHVNSCDPVVVNDSLAFVTLRSGNACESFTNELDVIDIRDLYNPVLLSTYSMINPYGLGLDKTTLFLCEGENGLKIFDVSGITENKLKLMEFYEEYPAFDVIPFNELLIMIGKNGLYQFDYSDINNVSLLSRLSITPVEE